MYKLIKEHLFNNYFLIFFNLSENALIKTNRKTHSCNLSILQEYQSENWQCFIITTKSYLGKKKILSGHTEKVGS